MINQKIPETLVKININQSSASLEDSGRLWQDPKLTPF